MTVKKSISPEESGAFVERVTLEPTGKGLLDGLTFAVKDLIDVKGHRTGCGNPTWRDTHPPASTNAICVEQLLSAGARCIGRTITDEMAFSLIGENYFYGSPLNPKAPERVTGGSSSGSASAVACGLADFALGTDTGGSVRVPASNCGIWGYRPSHGFVSVAGVNPLSPSFDTVGILSSNAETLTKAASILIATTLPASERPLNIHIIPEAFSLCDPEVRDAFKPLLNKLNASFKDSVRQTSIREFDSEPQALDLHNWYEIYRVLQRAEAESCLGSWVAATKPEFGPLITESFELIRHLDRNLIAPILERRFRYFERLNRSLGDRDLICIPSAPTPAPLKGTILRRESKPGGYYARTLALTSIAGVAKLPQISMPVASAVDAPVGLSILGRNGSDSHLLAVAPAIFSALNSAP
jgi:amidase